MSKKVEKNPKKGQPEKKEGSFPLCINKNEARMVCLSEECEDYPFFCSSCQDSSCEIAHQHEDKLTSVSYKQFTKRVLKQRKPTDALGQAMSSYRSVLQKLKQDVSEFIQKELAQLEEITKKAEEVPPEDDQMISKLKNQQYEGLTGVQMDQLWKNCAQDPEEVQAQEQTAEFIKIKEEEVKGISEHFQHLNHLDYNNIDEEQQEHGEGNKPKKPASNSTSSKAKK